MSVVWQQHLCFVICIASTWAVHEKGPVPLVSPHKGIVFTHLSIYMTHIRCQMSIVLFCYVILHWLKAQISLLLTPKCCEQYYVLHYQIMVYGNREGAKQIMLSQYNINVSEKVTDYQQFWVFFLNNVMVYDVQSWMKCMINQTLSGNWEGA